MDYGIDIAPAADSWKLVKRAEELGYSRAWFFDTHLLNAELFVAMGAAAVQSSKIQLGTGVIMVTNRIAPVAASGLASLNMLAPGRINFGISTGYTGRRTMGVSAVKLAEMKEYIRIVRELLAGEMTQWEFEGERRTIRMMSPEVGVYNLKDPIPLYISAFNPKARKLVAEMGANWIFTPTKVAHAKTLIDEMKQGWRAAGHDPEKIKISAEIAGCILAEGEPYDSPRAKAQAGPMASTALHNWAEADQFKSIFGPVPPAFEPAVKAYRKIYDSYQPADARYLSNHRGHLMFLRPDEQALCSADMIKAFTFTGTKADLQDRLRGLREAGCTQVSVQIRHGQPQMLEEWADLFASV
ncbi:MAG: LLM class flavin-dependent oxidoreductase [Candidatus Binataceae bacterium]|nr:LLM class flavin-dependent oxidoreductase [Candidatus Binataceae bacterium]